MRAANLRLLKQPDAEIFALSNANFYLTGRFIWLAIFFFFFFSLTSVRSNLLFGVHNRHFSKIIVLNIFQSLFIVKGADFQRCII